MFKLSVNVNFLFLIFTALFGTYFVKVGNGVFLYSLLAYNIFYFFRYVKLGGILLPAISFPIMLFFAICVIYVILSFFKVVNIFGLKTFKVMPAYILRQAYFIPFLFIIGSNIVYDIVRQNGQFAITMKYPMTICLSIVMIGLIIEFTDYMHWFDSTVVSTETTQLVIESTCLYVCFFKKKRKMVLTLIMVAIWDVLHAHRINGAILMLLFGLYYYRKPLSLYLKKIAIAVVLVVTCMITYNQQITAFLLKADVNTWWRFVYWSHEMNILRETDFVGVGFGTPYVRTDEFSSIDDFSNDATQQRGGFEAAASINEISYVVAQHNSFVNMYYRMGFIGGSSFIYINYFILLYSARLIKSLRRMKKDMELRFFLWSEFSYFGSISIIAFNVGLETPRYFIPYLISVSIHLGLIRKYNYIYESSLRKFKNIPEITGSIISKEKPTILIPATR